MSYPDYQGRPALAGPARPDARIATCLAELPRHRAEYLVWRFALRWSRPDIEARLAQGRWGTCRWQQDGHAPSGDHVAILGSDGRYHLCADGQPACAAARLPDGAYAQEDWCDCGQRLSDGIDARWVMTLTGHLADPASVPRRERCPARYGASAQVRWPLYHDQRSPVGRVRIELSQAFGRDCCICRRWAGTEIDHDPFTGYVRGLLCASCNILVCVCAHVSGCLFGGYLDDPPALPLRIPYPKLTSFLRNQENKIKRLGYDPFAELRARLTATQAG